MSLPSTTLFGICDAEDRDASLFPCGLLNCDDCSLSLRNPCQAAAISGSARAGVADAIDESIAVDGPTEGDGSTSTCCWCVLLRSCCCVPGRGNMGCVEARGVVRVFRYRALTT